MLSATYRIQFHAGFPFAAARELVPYLHGLGVSHLYASPITQARRGSTHGYDVTDPTRLNPELGTQEDFEALLSALHDHGIGLLLDIVPNHMSASSENPWWVDVLENGAASERAPIFDVAWDDTGRLGEDQILLPMLGDPFGAALEWGHLTVRAECAGLQVAYFDHRLPLDPATYGLALGPASGETAAPLRALLELADLVPPRKASEPKALAMRRRLAEEVKREFARLLCEEPGTRALVEGRLQELNGQPGNARSMDQLESLLQAQPYRLAYWRVAREKVNYRRFFDITDLVGVRVENPAVFEATHGFLLDLVRQGKVQGFRIDHVDGLFDPQRYLERLQESARKASGRDQPFPVLVEKITLGDEALPSSWPVDGTTGYDFAAILNGLLVDPHGLHKLDGFYRTFTGSRDSFLESVRRNKVTVMKDLFLGEMATLSAQLERLADQDRHARDLSPRDLGRALREVTACLRVYRTYVDEGEPGAVDRRRVEQAVAAARENTAIDPASLDFLRHVLLLELPPLLPTPERAAWRRFVRRWQQTTGPVMAKGVEDTTFYRYNRLVSLNEVGGDLATFSLDDFHRLMGERQRRWPRTLNATSTHDTKRSEDVRARLHAISEHADEWGRCAIRWHSLNRGHRVAVDHQPVPDANEELLVYQILLGAWPLHDDEMDRFRERVKEYLVKADREAKLHSSWFKPHEEHERAYQAFVDALLDPQRSGEFLDDFRTFQRKLARHGAVNSLSQVVLKVCCPGVPDFYQGTAAWDLSLVDPDNRRPVDFPQRMEVLELLRLQPEGGAGLTRHLLDNWTDGGLKVFVTQRALQFRRAHEALFAEGEYVPVRARDEVVAFLRRHGRDEALVAVPRFLSRLGGAWPLGEAWGEGRIPVTDGLWRDAFTGRELEPTSAGLPLADVFAAFPVALLERLR